MSMALYLRFRRYCWPVARWLGCLAAAAALVLGLVQMTILAIAGPPSIVRFHGFESVMWWSVNEPVRSTDFIYSFVLQAIIVATGVAFLFQRWRVTRALFVLGFAAFYVFACHFRIQDFPIAVFNLGVWLNPGDLFAVLFLWVTWNEMTCRMRGVIDPSVPALLKPELRVANAVTG